MKYLSYDLETTCLAPKHPDNILQVSMVVEDPTLDPPPDLTDLPHFTCFVKQPRISGEAYALSMNSWILDIISGRNKVSPYPIYSPTEWVIKAKEFLLTHFGTSKITVAGKNVASFDFGFTPPELLEMFDFKTVDPGNFFVNLKKDRRIPSLDECKRRAGVEGKVSHDAREDAMDVIAILRTKY